MTLLLDTNVVSEFRKPSPHPRVLAWASLLPPLATYISAMTVFELEVGVQRRERTDPAQGARLRRWLTDLIDRDYADRVLPIDAEIAVIAARMHVPDPKPEHDAFIAATAIHHGFTVVTRNVKDFAPLGVRVLDPWAVE